MKKTMLILAAVAATAGSAFAGVVYDVEKTNNWFTANVASISTAAGAAVDLTSATFSGGTLDTPTNGTAIATNQTIVLDTEFGDALTFTPTAAGGEVSLVKANIYIEPNVVTPDLDTLTDAQAALTVVTNTTTEVLEWYGIAKVSGATNEWVALGGDTPVAGANYDIEIAIDNTANKKIRYSVKLSSADSYNVLNYNESEWLNNSQSKTTIESVGFAGAGTFGNFSTDTVVNDGMTISGVAQTLGWDFTNGTVTATVGVSSGDYTGKTAVLTLNGETYNANVGEGGSVTFNVGGLTAGTIYDYTLTVKSDNVVRATETGSYYAGNFNTNYFGATWASNVATTNNGVLASAEEDAENNAWNVSGDATFTVADTAAATSTILRVDTAYKFDTFIDAASLDALDSDSLGGIVAVSDDSGTWKAYFGGAWNTLSDGVTPATNTAYIVRAEFDFVNETKRVKYSVSTDDGATFTAFTYDSSEWLSLVNQTATTLTSVGMSGKGTVSSIEATLVDPAVATVDGVKYFSLWEALQAANGGAITLLTNATLAPSGVTSGKFSASFTGDFEYNVDLSGLSGKWKWKEVSEGVYMLLKAAGAIYKFF